MQAALHIAHVQRRKPFLVNQFLLCIGESQVLVPLRECVLTNEDIH